MDSDKNKKHKKHKKERKALFWLIVLGLIIIALLAVIGTCSQQHRAHQAGTATRTPHDVSDFSVVFVNGEAILYWVDSDDAFLDHIEISWEPDGSKPIRVDKGSGKYILPGLEEGVEYHFAVKAVDKWGNKSSGRNGGTGKAHKLEKPVWEPDTQIMGITGTPVAGQATLSWTNPHPSEYEYIEIWYDPNGGERIRIPKGVESKTLTGLTNGVEHTFYAAAVDARGNRKSLKDLGLFISDHPTSPESVVGRPMIGEFTLVWDDPPDPALDHLEIAYSPNGETLMSVPKGAENKLLTGLSNGVKYEFTIYGVDNNGHRRPVTSTHLYPVNTSFREEDLDAIVSGKPLNGRIKLDWTDPELEGFDHVEIITNPLGNSKSMSVPRGMETNTYTGLSDNDEYSYLVYGIDKDGRRQVIRGVQLSTPTPTLSEDEINAIVRGKPVTGQIRLDWKTPALATVDHVEIVTNPDGQGRTPKTMTVARGAQTNNFTGLSDNDEYSFLVYGVDSNGAGRPINGVKLSTPKAPRIVGRPVKGELTLVWDDPKDANLDLIELDYSPRGEMPIAVMKGNGKFTFTGLADREYVFHVTAVTTEGNAYAMGARVVVPNIQTTPAVPTPVAAIPAAAAPAPTASAGGQSPARGRAPAGGVPFDETDEPLILEHLFPLNWEPVADTTFELSSINALSYGYSADRIPRWIAGGDDGKMAYSNDYGVTWTEVKDSHFGSFAINTICYTGHRWIAGGKNGKIAWSTDAITWTEAQNHPFSEPPVNIHIMVNADGRWMAGGGNGNIMFSEDNGLNWKLASNEVFETSTSDISALAFHGGRWIAGSTTGDLAWSNDHGITWNVIDDNPLKNNAINAIFYDKGRWMAAGYAQRIAWSNDGTAWQAMPRPFYVIAMGYNGFRWVAGGQEGRVAWTGDNAASWVTDNVGRSFFGDSWVEAVAFGRVPISKGRWLIGGQNGKLIFADERDDDELDWGGENP